MCSHGAALEFIFPEMSAHDSGTQCINLPFPGSFAGVTAYVYLDVARRDIHVATSVSHVMEAVSVPLEGRAGGAEAGEKRKAPETQACQPSPSRDPLKQPNQCVQVGRGRWALGLSLS
ncbi:hypothetical protein GGTG_03951 [Gaeumannomyces tritici R3-111a-1]|uniref:Uncharacterized protein n=1 Tax=Gaeumannomyces tritici (strain R3-111a-1) TaxID=644352 RepID=J3NRQ1_GAET3|nr:hypothetical protein GGTG_03951 [Gaeumannomyces tritici R3-111a-1]EJT78857.1 hypothetical protein GGTG_03951 [Gaeumannomyces tritici R3-111a-1]